MHINTIRHDKMLCIIKCIIKCTMLYITKRHIWPLKNKKERYRLYTDTAFADYFLPYIQITYRLHTCRLHTSNHLHKEWSNHNRISPKKWSSAPRFKRKIICSASPVFMISRWERWEMRRYWEKWSAKKNNKTIKEPNKNNMQKC